VNNCQQAPYTITKYLTPIGGNLNAPTSLNTPLQLPSSPTSIADLSQLLSNNTALSLYNVALGTLPNGFDGIINNMNGYTTGTSVTLGNLLDYLNDIAQGNLNDTPPNDPTYAMSLFYNALDNLATQANSPIVSNNLITSGNLLATVTYTSTQIGILNNNGYVQFIPATRATISIMGDVTSYIDNSSSPPNNVTYYNSYDSNQNSTVLVITYPNSSPNFIFELNNGVGTVSFSNNAQSYTINVQGLCQPLTIPVINCPDPCAEITHWTSNNHSSISTNPFFKFFTDYWTDEQITNSFNELISDEQDILLSSSNNRAAQIAALTSIRNFFTSSNTPPNPIPNPFPTSLQFHYTPNDIIDISIADLNTMLSEMVGTFGTSYGYNCQEMWSCWQGSVMSYAGMMTLDAINTLNDNEDISITDIIIPSPVIDTGDGTFDPNSLDNSDLDENIEAGLEGLAFPPINTKFDFLKNYFDCIGYYPTDIAYTSPTLTHIGTTLYIPAPASPAGDYEYMLGLCLQASYASEALFAPITQITLHDALNALTYPTDLEAFNTTNFDNVNGTDEETLMEIRHSFYECYSTVIANGSYNYGAFNDYLLNTNIITPIYLCSYIDEDGVTHFEKSAGTSISIFEYLNYLGHCQTTTDCPYTYDYYYNLINDIFDSPPPITPTSSECNTCYKQTLANFFLEQCDLTAASYDNISYFTSHISNYHLDIAVNYNNPHCSQSNINTIDLAHFTVIIDCDGGGNSASTTSYNTCPSCNPPNCIIPISFCLTFTKISDETEINLNTCDNLAAQDVRYSILEQIQTISDQQAALFSQQYQQNCLNIDQIHDVLGLSYTLKQQQYTLYYYDRAGNLIKTVPPEGVAPLESITNQNVKSRLVSPQHSLVTDYQYDNLGRVLRQHTPDGGTTRFWYNKMGMLRFSQNEKQAVANLHTYSYTKYDALARVIETGEVTDAAITTLVSGLSPNNNLTGINILGTAAAPTANRNSITCTFYTSPCIDIDLGGRTQEFLQNRVSYTYFAATDGTIKPQRHNHHTTTQLHHL
jgi:hypothetical protein